MKHAGWLAALLVPMLCVHGARGVDIEVPMPMDGFLALHVLDSHGRLVRRVVAEVERRQGVAKEPWDLKDETGTIVPPGDYRWAAIARPPFRLTYENTVFNAGKPPWPSSPRGPRSGQWMGDHGFPVSVATVGDFVFLGANSAESGDAVIATDLDGTKLWGHWTFGGFSGPWRIAADSRYAYLIVTGEGVKRVDSLNKFKMEGIFKFPYGPDFPKASWSETAGGAAVHGGRLYIGFFGTAASPPWLVPSFAAEDLDPDRSEPRVVQTGRIPVGGADRGYYAYDDIMAFQAAFLVGHPSLVHAAFGGVPAGAKPLKTVTVAFRKPVAVGSILIPDGRMKVAALRPGAPWRPDAPHLDAAKPNKLNGETMAALGEEDESLFPPTEWTLIPVVGGPGAPALARTAEGGLTTEALRFKLCDASSKLPFALILRRRFEDVAPRAERVYVDGACTPAGGWDVAFQDRPISPSYPAVMALIWPQAVSLRGLSLIRPATGPIAVDRWRGDAAADPRSALGDDAQWKELGVIHPEVARSYFVQPAAVRTLDFRDNVSTRALRFRAIQPAGSFNPYTGTHGAVAYPHRAGFDAVVAYRYVGEGVPVPEEGGAPAQRITEIQLPEGTNKATIVRHIPLSSPGNMVFDTNGTLYAVSGNRVVTVPLDGTSASREVVGADRLGRPTGLAMDSDGLLYVADWGRDWGPSPERLHVVKVFDPKTGRLVRTVGSPGGPTVGPWDPARMSYPCGIAVDRLGRLWVTEAYYQPKRVSVWSRDGKLEKHFMGPTYYGGAGALQQGGGGSGWLDERNPSVLNYDGMKFVIDWTTKEWRLASLLYGRGFGSGKKRHRPFLTRHMRGTPPDRVLYAAGRRYLVGDPSAGSVGLICVERDEVAVPVAAAGNLAAMEELDERPELREAFGKLDRPKIGFCWVDGNGDGEPQPPEIQLTDQNPFLAGYIERIGEDLSFRFPGARLRPSGIREDGTPTYDMRNLELLPSLPRDPRVKYGSNSSWTTADGRTFLVYNRLVAPDGKTILWEYLDRWITNFGLRDSGLGLDRPPGVLAGEFIAIGHFRVGKEEFFATNSDQGDWFVFTSDGFLVGCVFGGPTGYGKKFWRMPECEPGKTDLSGLRLDREHYGGCLVATESGKVYAVAGHNHLSIVRVDGLEELRRLSGTIRVTKEDVARALAEDVARTVARQDKASPRAFAVRYLSDPQKDPQGRLLNWLSASFLTIREHTDPTSNKRIVDAEASLLYDERCLYVAARARDDSPLTNSASAASSETVRTLFRQGDALDVQLGLDPASDPKRTEPVAGDIRLLVTRPAGRARPAVVLYRYVVPGTPAERKARFESPIAETCVDDIRELTDVDIHCDVASDGWRVEVAVPWASLGTRAPAPATTLRGDIGVLWSDRHGQTTVDRQYWSARSGTTANDLALEAAVIPALWGEFRWGMNPEGTGE